VVGGVAFGGWVGLVGVSGLGIDAGWRVFDGGSYLRSSHLCVQQVGLHQPDPAPQAVEVDFVGAAGFDGAKWDEVTSSSISLAHTQLTPPTDSNQHNRIE
jgi:hypothetical protein